MTINVSSRELWDGKENLTHMLTETTKNFLAVLGLNVAFLLVAAAIVVIVIDLLDRAVERA